MTEPPYWCPAHGQPGGFREWACPDDCEHFRAELERRIDDVKVNGNFTRTYTDDSGQRWKQRFRNHRPVDAPIRW